MNRYIYNIRNSKILWIVFFTSIFNVAFAEGNEAGSLSEIGFYTIFTLAAIVVIWAGSVVLNLLDIILRKRELDIYDKHGLDEYNASRSASSNRWSRLKNIFGGAVPLERESDILLDHNYDGIRELDNNLPPWWVYGFYLTIIIAIVYMGYYHFSSYGKSSAELYAIEMEEAEKSIAEFVSTQTDNVDENNVTLLVNESDLSAGMAIFKTNCVVCHLDHGGGAVTSVGPNLTDEYWVHGGGIKNVFKTIKYGVPAKGMISWKDQLSPGDMQKVSSYILSLQGTNPPNAKQPEGDLWVEGQETEDNEVQETEAQE